MSTVRLRRLSADTRSCTITFAGIRACELFRRWAIHRSDTSSNTESRACGWSAPICNWCKRTWLKWFCRAIIRGTPPQCRMLSPVFHPNIAPHAICVGDHWGRRIARIDRHPHRRNARLPKLNVKSPLNGEAARWVEQNKHRIPLDPVSLLPEEDRQDQSGTSSASAAKPASLSDSESNGASSRSSTHVAAESAVASPSTLEIKCPGCGASYRASAEWIGRAVRCKKCGHAFVCSAGPSK